MQYVFSSILNLGHCCGLNPCKYSGHSSDLAMSACDPL